MEIAFCHCDNIFPAIRWIHLNLGESKRFIAHIENHQFNTGRKQKIIIKRVLFLASVAFLLFYLSHPLANLEMNSLETNAILVLQKYLFSY